MNPYKFVFIYSLALCNIGLCMEENQDTTSLPTKKAKTESVMAAPTTIPPLTEIAGKHALSNVSQNTFTDIRDTLQILPENTLKNIIAAGTENAAIFLKMEAIPYNKPYKLFDDAVDNATISFVNLSHNNKLLSRHSNSEYPYVITDITSKKIEQQFKKNDFGNYTNDAALIVTLSFDGNQIASIDQNKGSAHIWDIKTKKQIDSFNIEQDDTLKYFYRKISFSPDNRKIAVVYHSKNNDGELNDYIKIIDIQTKESLFKLALNDAVICSLNFSPDSNKIVYTTNYNFTALDENSVSDINDPTNAIVYDLSTNKQLADYESDSKFFPFSLTNKYLIGLINDDQEKLINIHNIFDEEDDISLDNANSNILCQLSSNEKYLIEYNMIKDQNARCFIHDLTENDEIAKSNQFAAPSGNFFFLSKDNNYFIIGNFQKNITVLSSNQPKSMGALSLHQALLIQMAFNNNKKPLIIDSSETETQAIYETFDSETKKYLEPLIIDNKQWLNIIRNSRKSQATRDNS